MSLFDVQSVGVPGFEPGTLPTQSGCATADVQAKKREQKSLSTLFDRRGTRIRTWDPLVPNQVRYRTALHPDDFCFLIKDLASFKSVAKVSKFLKNASIF